MNDSGRGWAARLAGALARRGAPLLLAEIERARAAREALRQRDLLRHFQAAGEGVTWAPPCRVTDPRCVAAGAGAAVGPGAFVRSEGGVSIGAGARIGREALILTFEDGGPEPPRPQAVLIGPRAALGERVTVLPGARIGAGARVPSGSVVAGVVPGEEPRAAAAPAGEGLFFVVGTGRCGTLTISRLLSRHPQLECRHEPRPQWIRLSTEWAHGQTSADAVRTELEAFYRRSAAYPAQKRCGEADQKLWNLIGFLAELLPAARFVWLIRDGRDVVASTFGQEWFPSAARPGHPTAAEHYERWLYYRLNGAACGAFGAAEWERLPLFEKNAWHWAHVNRGIEQAWSALPAERRFFVRLEELAAQTEALCRFLGVAPQPLPVEQGNRATYPVKRWPQWSAAERSAFERWCGAEMDRWYPAWRRDWRG